MNQTNLKSVTLPKTYRILSHLVLYLLQPQLYPRISKTYHKTLILVRSHIPNTHLSPVHIHIHLSLILPQLHCAALLQFECILLTGDHVHQLPICLDALLQVGELVFLLEAPLQLGQVIRVEREHLE